MDVVCVLSKHFSIKTGISYVKTKQLRKKILELNVADQHQRKDKIMLLLSTSSNLVGTKMTAGGDDSLLHIK